jgi:hypothetical protein
VVSLFARERLAEDEMGFREVLQTELWKKWTTGKVLGGLVIVAGLLIGGLSIWRTVYTTHWISPQERSAAKVALAQIDGLQGLEYGSGRNLARRDIEAQEAVATAEGSERTVKDWRVYEALQTYINATWEARRGAETGDKMGSTPMRDMLARSIGWLRGSNPMPGQWIDASEADMMRALRFELHKTLD